MMGSITGTLLELYLILTSSELCNTVKSEASSLGLQFQLSAAAMTEFYFWHQCISSYDYKIYY